MLKLLDLSLCLMQMYVLNPNALHHELVEGTVTVIPREVLR